MTRVVLGDAVRLLLETERSFLKREEVEFVPAESAGEAARVAKAVGADLVVLDVRKDEDDAVSLCRGLKGAPETKGLPVVVLVPPAEHDAAVEAGADAVVVKPATAERLLAAITGILSLPGREVERASTTIKVEFRRGKIAGFGFLKDLGANGLFLKTRERFAEGDEVELSFVLPTSGPHRIEATGIVVRTVAEGPKGHPAAGIALRFSKISGEDRHLLARFVRDHEGARP